MFWMLQTSSYQPAGRGMVQEPKAKFPVEDGKMKPYHDRQELCVQVGVTHTEGINDC